MGLQPPLARYPLCPPESREMEAHSNSRGPGARLPECGLGVIAPLVAAMTLISCSTISNAVISHAVQPHLGPCASAMDSVRKDRGAPTRKEYNETEDLDTRQQQVEHVWYYTATAESPAVVRFSWNSAGSDCTITEKPSNA